MIVLYFFCCYGVCVQVQLHYILHVVFILEFSNHYFRFHAQHTLASHNPCTGLILPVTTELCLDKSTNLKANLLQIKKAATKKGIIMKVIILSEAIALFSQ